MYIVLAYDFSEKRVTKAKRICDRYLHAVQKSVFEGELTKSKLDALKDELKAILVPKEDYVIIYRLNTASFLHKEAIGKFSPDSNII